MTQHEYLELLKDFENAVRENERTVARNARPVADYRLHELRSDMESVAVYLLD